METPTKEPEKVAPPTITSVVVETIPMSPATPTKSEPEKNAPVSPSAPVPDEPVVPKRQIVNPGIKRTTGINNPIVVTPKKKIAEQSKSVKVPAPSDPVKLSPTKQKPSTPQERPKSAVIEKQKLFQELSKYQNQMDMLQKEQQKFAQLEDVIRRKSQRKITGFQTRGKLISHMYDSEKEYNNAMMCIPQLLDAIEGDSSPAFVRMASVVFQDVDCIRLINKDFFSELETEVGKNIDKLDSMLIGKLILKRIPTFRMYKTYINGFYAAIDKANGM